MTHDGKKMGKTEKGALWLDPDAHHALMNSTSTGATWAMQDVERFLSAAHASCPWTRCAAWARCPAQQINEAKRVLAFEVTKLIHGEAEAQ